MQQNVLKPFLIIVISLIVIGLISQSIFNLQYVLFWTDALLFLLIMAIFLFVLFARQKPYIKQSWMKVFKRPVGMATFLILMVYVFFGVLDSIHFKSNLMDKNQKVVVSASVKSVLDVILTPLSDRVEKTYSAPFATHLFVKENVEQSDGTISRQFPRLKYGGAHLKDPIKDKSTDIFWRFFMGLFLSLIIIGVVVFLLMWVLKIRLSYMSEKDVLGEVCAGKGGELPWRTIILTFSGITILVCVAIMLSTKYHVLGTDKVGQDVLFLSLKSIRTGLLIGTLSTLVMLPFAIALGVMAGYYRGWVDDVIQYIYTTLNSIPSVLLIAAAVLMVVVHLDNYPVPISTEERADLRLLFLCIILGITSWTGLCRLLRGETLKLRELDYVQAAQTYGVSHLAIMWRHIVPNVMHIVVIYVALDFSILILAEAVLSYVNVGVDPAMNSWGNMINSARLEMAREPVVWWSLMAAFIFMFTLVLTANLFSDVVRDAFDPRLNNA